MHSLSPSHKRKRHSRSSFSSFDSVLLVLKLDASELHFKVRTLSALKRRTLFDILIFKRDMSVCIL